MVVLGVVGGKWMCIVSDLGELFVGVGCVMVWVV